VIEKIKDFNVNVYADNGSGKNRIRIFNGEPCIGNLWITNTGELDSPNDELDMELRALYYAIEYIAVLERKLETA